jgi:hypothetical protein
MAGLDSPSAASRTVMRSASVSEPQARGSPRRPGTRSGPGRAALAVESAHKALDRRHHHAGVTGPEQAVVPAELHVLRARDVLRQVAAVLDVDQVTRRWMTSVGTATCGSTDLMSVRTSASTSMAAIAGLAAARSSAAAASTWPVFPATLSEYVEAGWRRSA